MKVSIIEGAFAPVKAHAEDGGFDLKSPIEILVPPILIILENPYMVFYGFSRIQGRHGWFTDYVPARGDCVIDTGVRMAIKRGYAGLPVSKSGLNTLKGITSTGLVDSGYTGNIKVKLYNNSDYDYLVRRGDKISQIVIIPISDDNGIEVVDVLDTVSERGNNGFGSTGR